ncbi:type II toxin-antitoxin system VapC family toxin [Thermus caliditerrae]|uniref:type II toxin-antitoxin system VapC family toxin n=1 Tax=Thermus caliditerrae TaxID=1330700 RepID=UPI00068969CC|nr:type II toxin-antitoxin system VapC family toxin [Thermus caliditerrae]
MVVDSFTRTQNLPHWPKPKRRAYGLFGAPAVAQATTGYLGLEVLPLTKEPYREAVWAHARYGKNRHPAGLNLGDCLSYAVARVEGEPLRYKGEDFRKTDLGKG